MKKRITITYERALELALPYFDAFHDKHEWYYANSDGRDFDWRKFHQNELTALANGCCCACDMVCDLFGASDEQVHDDLMALRHERGQK